MSVYKLTSQATPKIYIGSTTYPLQVRYKKHRYDFTEYNKRTKPCGWISSYALLVYPDCKIELIEGGLDFTTLRQREQFYLDKYKDIVVNKCRAVRIPYKEYYQQNKQSIINYQLERYNTKREDLIEYQKQWNRDNKQKCKAYMRKYLDKISIHCNACNRSYSNLKGHEKTKKHILNTRIYRDAKIESSPTSSHSEAESATNRL